MRGKQAKKLRRLAEDLTIGKPWVSYEGTKVTMSNKKIRRTLQLISAGMADIKELKDYSIKIRLKPNCGREVYQRLKLGVSL